jgi:hypothetical protein
LVLLIPEFVLEVDFSCTKRRKNQPSNQFEFRQAHSKGEQPD